MNCADVISVLLAAWVHLQVPAAPPAPGLRGGVEDVRRFEQPSNEARFETLAALLRERGVPFEVERFTVEAAANDPRTEGRNVVVTIGEGEPDLLLGAHYDAARLADGRLAAGAVDNAASTVVLVRLAEALLRDPPPARLRIVFFDMEERGLLGSAAYLKRHGTSQLDAVLNLDINGYGDTVLYGPAGSEANAALRRSLLETCAAGDYQCIPFPQMPPGDDRTFTEAGVPTLSLAMLPAIEAHQVWLLVNAGEQAGLAQGTAPAILRTIHTAADTSEHVRAGTMGQVFEFVRALTARLARSR